MAVAIFAASTSTQQWVVHDRNPLLMWHSNGALMGDQVLWPMPVRTFYYARRPIQQGINDREGTPVWPRMEEQLLEGNSHFN